MTDAIYELIATETARHKLGARGISAVEVAQLPRNRYTTLRNSHRANEYGARRLLVGRTDGGRALTLVIEPTVEPTTWLIITGWPATMRERKIIN